MAWMLNDGSTVEPPDKPTPQEREANLSTIDQTMSQIAKDKLAEED